jgi:hypothetical protein
MKQKTNVLFLSMMLALVVIAALLITSIVDATCNIKGGCSVETIEPRSTGFGCARRDGLSCGTPWPTKTLSGYPPPETPGYPVP